MILCDNNHTEICYEARYCPLCELIEISEKKDKEIGILEDRLSESDDIIIDLENTIKELNKGDL